MFPDTPACIERMATTFAYFEDAVHAPFYNNLNAALNLDNEEFYNSYMEDEVLVERMKFIGRCINDDDDAFSLATFSMVEGSILYSAFAFFMHFTTEGKGKLLNLNAGINYSVNDENMHSQAGAYLYSLNP